MGSAQTQTFGAQGVQTCVISEHFMARFPENDLNCKCLYFKARPEETRKTQGGPRQTVRLTFRCLVNLMHATCLGWKNPKNFRRRISRDIRHRFMFMMK